jgi:hypothetical protein
VANHSPHFRCSRAVQRHIIYSSAISVPISVPIHRVLVGKPEEKRPLGRPRHRWENNIKMDLQEVGWGRGDWMELAQDRDSWRALVGTVRDFRVP